MNVLLIELEGRHPLFKAPLWMPMYLPSAASVLRARGHAVQLVERGGVENGGPGAKSFKHVLQEHLGASEVDIVLFNVPADAAADLGTYAEAVRRACPLALILAGGRHPTLCPIETLEDAPALDAVILGEPENVLPRLVSAAALADTPSVAFRKDGEIHRQQSVLPVEELDALPLPAWDLLDMSYHARRTPRVIPCIPLKTATLATSRGCPEQCAFCEEGRLHAKRHRAHSPGYVVEAIHHLVGKYGIDGVYFCDESFLADRERVLRLCEEFQRRGIPGSIRWAAQARADSVDPELLRALRAAGCVQLEFGIESGSQRMLDSMAKRATVEQNAAAIRMSREAGVRSLAYLMFAMPGETRDDLRATARFLGRAQPELVRFIRFVPYPGTPAAQELIAQGRLPAHFWRETRGGNFRKFVGQNVSAMDDTTLRREARRFYFRHVFPTFLGDYLRHNRLADLPQHFHLRRLPPFLWRKVSRTP